MAWPSKLTELQRRSVCRLYARGWSQARVGQHLGITQSYVKDLLKRYGVIARPSAMSAPLNDRFFRRITTERPAYWLGFLAADGCIQIPQNRQPYVTISLALRDINHLRCLRRDMASKAHFIYWHATARSNRNYPAVRLNFVSRKLVSDLLKLGIGPRKTQTIRIPQIPKRLMHHFLRGYFDGDGSILVRRPGRRRQVWQLRFVVTGNPPFIDAYARQLRWQRTLQNRPQIFQHGNYATLDVLGNRQVRRIFGRLYHRATRYLPRKRAVFLRHL